MLLFTFDDEDEFTAAPSAFDSGFAYVSDWDSSGILRNFAGESGQAIAHNGDNTFRFDVELAPGKGLLPHSVSFWARRSSAGSPDWVFSVNGTPLASASEMTDSASGVEFGNVLLEPAITEPLSGEVFFTLETIGASSGAGTFRVDNFTLHGTISPIPEPRYYAAALGLIALAFVGWRHRAKRLGKPLGSVH